MALKYVLFGNMCSGKTTVGQILKNEFGYAVVSAKDVIGRNIKTAGESLKNLRKKGYLLPDNIITEWIFDEVKTLMRDNSSIVLDGYPRTGAQAGEVLKTLGGGEKIIYLDFDIHIIEKRFLNRIICNKCDMPYSRLFQDFQNTCSYCHGVDFSPRITDKPDYFQVKTTQFNEISLEVISVFRKNGVEILGLKDYSLFKELRKDVIKLVSRESDFGH